MILISLQFWYLLYIFNTHKCPHLLIWNSKQISDIFIQGSINPLSVLDKTRIYALCACFGLISLSVSLTLLDWKAYNIYKSVSFW